MVKPLPYYPNIDMTLNFLIEEEELGALIYNFSRTAKLFRVKEEGKPSAAVTESTQLRGLGHQRRRSICFATKAQAQEAASCWQTLRARLHRKIRKVSYSSNTDESKSDEDDRTPRKRVRCLCSIDECTNNAKTGGVCIRHGTKQNLANTKDVANMPRWEDFV